MDLVDERFDVGIVITRQMGGASIVTRRLMTDYQLPRFEIKVAYPSRRHLSAKVRTFIDHLIAHFADSSNLLTSEGAAQRCESVSPQLQAA